MQAFDFAFGNRRTPTFVRAIGESRAQSTRWIGNGPRRSKPWRRLGSIQASGGRFGRAEKSRSGTIGHAAMRYSCRSPSSRSTFSIDAEPSTRFLAEYATGTSRPINDAVARGCSARRTRRAPTREDARRGSTTSRGTLHVAYSPHETLGIHVRPSRQLPLMSMIRPEPSGLPTRSIHGPGRTSCSCRSATTGARTGSSFSTMMVSNIRCLLVGPTQRLLTCS